MKVLPLFRSNHFRAWLIIGGVVWWSFCIGVMVRHVLEPRVVAQAVAPDGTRMCIIQRFGDGGEPFTSAFVYRKPGKQWGWFYYDHEDWYWGSAHSEVDPVAKTAVFFRDGKPAVTFQWETETYTLWRWQRTLTGAQDSPYLGILPKELAGQH